MCTSVLLPLYHTQSLPYPMARSIRKITSIQYLVARPVKPVARLQKTKLIASIHLRLKLSARNPIKIPANGYTLLNTGPARTWYSIPLPPSWAH